MMVRVALEGGEVIAERESWSILTFLAEPA